MSIVWLPRIAVMALATFVLIQPAEADTSASQWIKQYRDSVAQTRQIIERITAAEEDGMGWHAARTKVETYCPPKKLSLTGNQLLDILGRSIESSPALGEQPWALALLLSLEKTFPCPNVGANRP